MIRISRRSQLFAAVLGTAAIICHTAALGQRTIVTDGNDDRLFPDVDDAQIKKQFDRFAKTRRPSIGPADSPAGVEPDPHLNDYMRRALAQVYDCPSTNSRVFARLAKPVFTLGALYAAMTAAERAECDAEGTTRAASRISERLRLQPQLMRDDYSTSHEYLKFRTTLVRTQCEADLLPMKEARSRSIEASSKAFLGGSEDFRWDFARVARNAAFGQLPTEIKDQDITLQFGYSAGSDTEPPSFSMTAVGLPKPTHLDFEWKDIDVVVRDTKGYQPIRLVVADGIVIVPDVDLEPLPLATIPVEANWHEKAKGNPSKTTRGDRWYLPDGYKFCRHHVTVRSANNVCENFLETFANGIHVEAKIMSGSEIDTWDGWLRFGGTLVGISTDATECQKSRAKCVSYGSKQQFADMEKGAQCSWSNRASTKAECFREGIPGREICHFGRYDAEGRCRVEEIRACY